MDSTVCGTATDVHQWHCDTLPYLVIDGYDPNDLRTMHKTKINTISTITSRVRAVANV